MDKVIMAGAVFNVDRKERRFVRSVDPKVIVPFEALVQEGELGKVNLHEGGKYLVSDQYAEQYPSDVKVVFVPMEIIHPNFQVGVDYVATLNEKSYRNDWNFLGFDEKIIERQNGISSTLELAGNHYTVDIEGGHLKPVGREEDPIPLYSKLRPRMDELKELWCHQGRSFYYDVLKWKEVDLDFRATQLPENIYLVTIPHPRILDPIGIAINYNQEPTALLHEHPVNRHHKAICLPLSETSFPEVIRRNQIAKEAQGFKAEEKKDKPRRLGKKRNG